MPIVLSEEKKRLNAMMSSMRFLALDVGDRRTGVAYLDEATGVVVPVMTITAADRDSLVHEVLAIASARKIDRLVVGIPRLPSGVEGRQAFRTREIITELSKSLPVDEIDERFSSIPLRKKGGGAQEISDSDTWAACQMLNIYLDRRQRN